MTEEENISEKEAEELLRSLGESKSNIHNFLTSIVKNPDTTRIANITKEELGLPQLPLRTYMELDLICGDDDEWGSYFKGMKEVITAPTLSKEGFLIKQATLQRREITAVTNKKKEEKKGMFSKKEEKESEE